MKDEKPAPKPQDLRKKPEEEKGQDNQRSSRTPDSEPPKDKRSDDL